MFTKEFFKTLDRGERIANNKRTEIFSMSAITNFEQLSTLWVKLVIQEKNTSKVYLSNFLKRLVIRRIFNTFSNINDDAFFSWNRL